MCAFSVAWDNTTPPGSQAASLGDNRITEFKVQVDQRIISGSSGTNGLCDLTNNRTIDSDPMEINPDKVDTAALDKGAGGYDAVARACTYFKIGTLTSHFNLPSNEALWASSGLTVEIPNTVLMSSGLERTDHAANSGTALGSDDYAIKLTAQFNWRMTSINSTADGGDTLLFRIRNTDVPVTIGPGDAELVGAAATIGVRSTVIDSGQTTKRGFVSWVGYDVSARTDTATYEVEVALVSATTSSGNYGIAASAECPAYLIAEVFKR